MATYTPNYNLKKPDPENFVDIADLNGNADIVDKVLKEKADLDENGKLLPSQLPETASVPAAAVIAHAGSKDGASYNADGTALPSVEPGTGGMHTGKGTQILFIPYLQNTVEDPTLSLNGGAAVPIRLRAAKNQSTNDTSPSATVPIPVGALMRGVPYMMTFCGLYWLIDSHICTGETENSLCCADTPTEAAYMRSIARTVVGLTDSDTVGMPIVNSMDEVEDEIAIAHIVRSAEEEASPAANGNVQIPSTGKVEEWISSGGAPAYVVEESNRVAQMALSHQNENTISFLAISDMHNRLFDGDTATVKDALTHAGQAMALLRKKLQLDFAVNFGDYTWGAKDVTTKEMGRTEMLDSLALCHESFRDIPHFYLKGNHDDLAWAYDGYFTPSENFAMIGKRNVGSVYPGTEKERGYCYRDFDDLKLRVIVLNTVDSKGVAYPVDLLDSSGEVSSEKTTIARISPEQLRWLADEALDLTGKAGWSVIVLGHHYLKVGYTKLIDSEDVYWDQGCSHAVTILDAYVSGASGSVTMPISGETVSYDFSSGKNAASLIATFNGHIHNFKTGVQGSNEIPWITIPNAFPGRDNERGKQGEYVYGEETTYPKIAGTAEDTSFCVVTIDFAENKIYADHYGAGYDRVIGYSGTTVQSYSVTNNLTYAKTSNSTATVYAGQTYKALIIPLSGYRLTTVNVSVAGVDVTDKLVPSLSETGCTITTEVTGNIVITAIAEKKESESSGNYTNLVPQATTPVASGENPSAKIYNGGLGYKNNTRMSGASDVELAGYVATGLIPYKITGGDSINGYTFGSIYIKGVTIDTSLTYVRFVTAYTDISTGLVKYNRYGVGGSTTESTMWSTYFDVEKLADQYYKLTPKATSGRTNGFNAALFGIRFSFVGSGENLIITVDEPIE